MFLLLQFCCCCCWHLLYLPWQSEEVVATYCIIGQNFTKILVHKSGWVCDVNAQYYTASKDHSKICHGNYRLCMYYITLYFWSRMERKSHLKFTWIYLSFNSAFFFFFFLQWAYKRYTYSSTFMVFKIQVHTMFYSASF